MRSVTSRLQMQCYSNALVVGLNTQYESTYSTTVFEFNTTMALVVLMERRYFVSAGNETEATGHFTCYLSERRG